MKILADFRKIVILIGFGFLSLCSRAQVGINTTEPHSSAALDVFSTSKGLLLPRLSAEQRNSIQNPAAGLILWCHDCGSTGEINIFNGSMWTNAIGNPAQLPNTFLCGTSTVTFIYNNTEVTYGTVLGANGKCWLDRNLGALQVATASNDPNSYGDLFQWGRLDDGHQIRSSDLTNTLSMSDNPGHNDFIVAPNTPYDWRQGQNNNLWQGITGINNPCPEGFRLPTEAEWLTELGSWNPTNKFGAFNSSLKLPTAGFRFSVNGNVSFEGSYGYYWSNTVNGTSARKLFFDNNGANTYNYLRADGLSVRCIKN